jgi:glucose/arabinose dehydrogenase
LPPFHRSLAATLNHRVVLNQGQPTGEYEDFLTGFVIGDGRVWGRPVGVAFDNQGALLVSEDAGGTL